ncbi:MAG TPA: class I SAM-dependent methyltransferase [Candidatus Sulfotelmatobacter sp.]|jgi:NDP-4-keto-2,6-dideoxyhexose 3-C-methyltransferase|nr:class I SAM-dependent methyltransferase [Candidatus Sulfotelmatobacter sp.]
MSKKSPITLRKTCRVCGSRKLEPILSLGNQYAVGFLDSAKETAGSGPLDLILCNIKDGGCGLLQLKHTYDHDLLYRKYWYKSGISTTMVAALGDIVNCAQKVVPLKKGDLVIDIGANDGTLLRQYKRTDIQKVGFEPSNLWELATKDNGNAKIIHDYFNEVAFAKNLPGKKAKIITSISMFYDLEEPNSFVADIVKCLDADGLWICQMNYLGLMMDDHTYDNISHEHLEYYSLISVENLMKRHGLEIFDVELNDVNGGSYRLYIRRPGAKLAVLPGGAKRVSALRAKELKRGYNGKKVYASYAKEIAKLKKELMTILSREKKAGKKIYIYGASTRGLVVLQYCGIDKKYIDFAVDKNSDKWGKYIVGTGIQCISFDDYRKNLPDYLLVLPYQFKREIIQQEAAFLKAGGKMIFALPRVQVITKKDLK